MMFHYRYNVVFVVAAVLLLHSDRTTVAAEEDQESPEEGTVSYDVNVPLAIDFPIITNEADLYYQACLTPFSGGPWWMNLSTGQAYAPVSQVSGCIANFPLQKEHLTQHLQSMHNLTRDFYVFVHTAVDPLASLNTPQQSPPPFGYSIYNGTNHGQVDVLKELNTLLDGLDTGSLAPTVDVLLEHNAIFNRLWDAHVAIDDDLSIKGIYDSTVHLLTQEMIAAKNVNASSEVDVSQLTVGDTNGKFTMAMTFAYKNTTTKDVIATKTKTIVSIDGKEPMQFLIELANVPLGFVNLKALGPRVSGLLRALQAGGAASAASAEDDNPFFGILPGNINFAKFLKDSYPIVYDDGTNSAWYLLQSIPPIIGQNATRAATEEALSDRSNRGMLYDNFAMAQLQLNELLELYGIDDTDGGVDGNGTPTSTTSVVPSQRQRSLLPEIAPPIISSTVMSANKDLRGGTGKRRTLQELPSVDFTMAGSDIGYAIFDGYAVFKIAGFQVVEQDLLQAWIGMLDEASYKGITKVMIDLTLNSGGDVSMAYLLSLLMHPEAEYEDLINSNDQLFSDSIDVFWSQIAPIVANISDTLEQESIAPLLASLNSDLEMLAQKLEGIVITLTAVQSIDPQMSIIAAVAAAEGILGDVNATTPPTAMTEEQLALMSSTLLSAFQDISDDDRQTSLPFSLNFIPNPQSVSYSRGGIVAKYTSLQFLLSRNEFQEFKSALAQIDDVGQFEQYLILSDGYNVGSSACLFQTTSAFYAKGNEKAIRPVNTVAYGGTGNPEDASTTQFCGGAVLSSDLNPLWTPDLLLGAFGILFEGNTDKEAAIGKAVAAFSAATPEPCYFCNKAPEMPLLEAFSVIGGTSSVPLEYVHQVADFYIPQWVTGNTFEQSYQLGALYSKAAKFFDRQESVGSGANGRPTDLSFLSYFALSIGVAVLFSL